MGRLGIRPADIEPKATEHIPDVIKLIERLLTKGHAYRLNGDVYYQVATYPAYGRLSKRKTEDLLAGARVEVDERKRNPMDFALWKSSKPGEPAWDSPWGPGRPGWHIECSAMAIRHLGETFDIHGGGMDLIFPHHENEIAQSCAATDKEFARYWMHNGFVQVNQEKMSKSLGNFFTIREIFEKWGLHWDEGRPKDQLTAEVLRYFLLATHYRSPLDFSDQGLEEARKALNGFYGLFQRLEESSLQVGSADKLVPPLLAQVEESFHQAMSDDFNTPAAIAEFQRLRNELNKLLETGLSKPTCDKARATFRSLGLVLGLFQLPSKDWQFNVRLQPMPMAGESHVKTEMTIARGSQALSDKEIEQQLAERLEARKRKDFAKADAIREALEERGITIEDRPDGTSRWKR
jgi:cysteinyl-tRNA synthetase